jgi:hypothetical protein
MDFPNFAGFSDFAQLEAGLCRRLEGLAEILMGCFDAMVRPGVLDDSFFLSGCATKELYRDQDQLRHVVIDLYTNQVMDNLIRAVNCQLLVHMDYATISGNVTIKTTANLGGNQEFDGTNTINKLTAGAAGTVSAVTRLSKNILNYGGTGEHTNQVSMIGAPVNNADDIYEAYYVYLGLPNALLVSDRAPLACDAHIVKKHCGKWYWVPMERRVDFLKLQMATTVTRGKRLVKFEESYSVKLKYINDVASDKFVGAYEFTLGLDKKIPVDDGYVEMKIGTFKHSFSLNRDPKNTAPTTDKIYFRYNAKRYQGAEFPKELQTYEAFKGLLQGAADGYPAQIFLEQFRPQPPTLKDLLDPVYQQLEIIKLNQNR